MSNPRSPRIGLAALLLSVPLGLGSALAGDLERNVRVWGFGNPPACYPPPVPVVTYVEHLANPSGVPWELRLVSASDPTAVPGFSASACSAANQAPGWESIVSGMTAWNDVAPPGTGCPPTGSNGSPATLFSMAATPTITYTAGVANDSRNVVTCLQAPSWFGPTGASVVLAATPVTISQCGPIAAGTILDADIALNVSDPRVSWVEWNQSTPGLSGMTFLTNLAGPSQLDAYVDIVGVVTHEVGHLAGLGHSLIDGTASAGGSSFPTMFPVAQLQPFQELVTPWNGAGCAPRASIQVAVDGSGTTLGGVMGLSARTLEPDDVAAISRGGEGGSSPWSYVGPGFSSLGTISGTVYAGGSQQPEAGCVVVAIRKDCPNDVRVATFSYGIGSPSAPYEGLYTLSGLVPGEYYVYAESIDSGTDRYFADQDLPSYVSVPPVSNPGAGCGACMNPSLPLFNDGGVPHPSFFATEFYNAGDTYDEKSQVASVLTVTAGGYVSGVDFWLGPQVSPLLTVKPAGSPASEFSARGLMTPASSGGTPTSIEYRVSAGQPGSVVRLYFDDELRCVDTSGQLKLVNPSGSGGSLPVVVQGVLDASGEWSHVRQVAGSELFQNTFAQAVVLGGDVSVTNVVNTWVNVK